MQAREERFGTVHCGRGPWGRVGARPGRAVSYLSGSGPGLFV